MNVVTRQGNEENSGVWEWKKLKIRFGFIAVFDWNAPDLKNDCSTILEVKYDEDLEKLYDLEESNKRKYVNYLSPLFDEVENYLCISFYLSNFQEGIKDNFGYLKVIGSNVTLEWVNDNCLIGQIHIPFNRT
ncbi:hypothetical protein [Desulfosporosinus sp. OT]|uniref:hypothetical protein n=1 Tax=Desulfosporosinus sp. OT TaxID=913865 RepID=UPI000223A166|nr:hypothetical protein [Desulfosporosinus sp. OT]EGW39314.1 hypothetical protein DOT_2776 [Desulfosporosinus sp. OT]